MRALLLLLLPMVLLCLLACSSPPTVADEPPLGEAGGAGGAGGSSAGGEGGSGGAKGCASDADCIASTLGRCAPGKCVEGACQVVFVEKGDHEPCDAVGGACPGDKPDCVPICNVAEDCPPPAQPCQVAACDVAWVCVDVASPEGAPCEIQGVNGRCYAGDCIPD